MSPYITLVESILLKSSRAYLCQFLYHTSPEGKLIMSTCNQISGAASTVAMIRRMRSRKSVSSNGRKAAPVAAVVHQTSGSLQAAASEGVAEAPRYMNSYRLEPKNRFNCALVQTVLEEIVNKHCSGVKYDPMVSVSKVRFIAGDIMRRVKSFQFDRYRLVVLVQVGQNSGQGFETAAKFLWDASKDRFATYSLTNGSMFTTATCFGVYQD